jgi:hypothetical protein
MVGAGPLSLERLVPEWQWLLSYSAALKAASALLHRTPFPATFRLLARSAIEDTQDEAYVSMRLLFCFSLASIFKKTGLSDNRRRFFFLLRDILLVLLKRFHLHLFNSLHTSFERRSL